MRMGVCVCALQIAQVQEKIELLKADLNSRTNAEVENRCARALLVLLSCCAALHFLVPCRVLPLPASLHRDQTTVTCRIQDVESVRRALEAFKESQPKFPIASKFEVLEVCTRQGTALSCTAL